jgi:hypothetical protein
MGSGSEEFGDICEIITALWKHSRPFWVGVSPFMALMSTPAIPGQDGRAI